jgi:HrpA-like RNA helicase
LCTRDPRSVSLRQAQRSANHQPYDSNFRKSQQSLQSTTTNTSSTAATSTNLSLEGKPFSNNYYTLRAKAQTLPVSRHLPQLLVTFKENNVMILEGETGSGKTTQLPKAILEAGLLESGKKIALTQTRRLAASEVRFYSDASLIDQISAYCSIM